MKALEDEGHGAGGPAQPRCRVTVAVSGAMFWGGNPLLALACPLCPWVPVRGIFASGVSCYLATMCILNPCGGRRGRDVS